MNITDVFWIIPSSVDLNKKLKEKPPGFKYKIDHFYHIIDHIFTSSDYEDLDNNAAFVGIDSRYLQSFNKYYKKYISYLLQENIILKDNYYIPDDKYIGYKLHPFLSYNAEILNIRIGDFKCRQKKFQELISAQKRANTEYPVLTKWFNNNLKIDIVGAINKIDLLFPKPTEGIRGVRRYHRKYAKTPDEGSKRLKALGAVKRIAEQDFYYHIDNNIGRFHSNLTNIKRELRHYLTYDNKKLVNIDIKSAQPFLSQLLLTKSFYETNPNFLTINDFPIIKQILETRIIKSVSISHYIMLGKAVQKADIQELNRYFGLVESGLFYEKLHELLFSSGTKFDKVKFKQEVYRLLFSKNRSQSDFKKRFKQKFPDIYKIFSIYKRSDHSVLSRILQSMESKIMIQKVSKRIGLERPSLPIFSIHDSFITIRGNEDFVQQMIVEETEKLTGLVPKLGIEYLGN